MHAHAPVALKQMYALDVVGALLLGPVPDKPNCLFELSVHLGHCSLIRCAELLESRYAVIEHCSLKPLSRRPQIRLNSVMAQQVKTALGCV